MPAFCLLWTLPRLYLQGPRMWSGRVFNSSPHVALKLGEWAL
ncbi:Hypothetical Protein RSKD131_2260 [Cereibacter sphaeroides KD131]|nr:Hypothetical Protein RSKD131_2260 [Cereibacter sphaeroides KD131]